MRELGRVTWAWLLLLQLAGASHVVYDYKNLEVEAAADAVPPSIVDPLLRTGYHFRPRKNWINGVGSKSINITNSCVHTVWPAISSVAGSAALDTTGLELAPGQWEILAVPSGWSGRVWGRTLCSSNGSTENSGARFTCVTGDCGSGRQDCAGGNAVPPVTLAQFTLDGSGGMDFYDISLVDGYNLPMLVTPQGAAPAGGNCTPVRCEVDLNGECPAELRVTAAATGALACKSACLAFGSPQYCCTGAYGNPDTCKPSAYSQLFKKACPKAFSYAYDGADSIFTCGAGGESNTFTYTITFCPSNNSAKPSTSPYSQPPGAGNLPHIDGTTPYTGGGQVGGATAASTPWRIILVVGVLGAVTAALVVLEKFLGLFKLCFSFAKVQA